LGLLAADAVVEMEIRLPATVQVVRYNREDYTARLREGFKLGNEFIYERSRSDIMMSPGEEHAEIVAWAKAELLVRQSMAGRRYPQPVGCRDARRPAADHVVARRGHGAAGALA
jgi:hypothetical protein